MLPFNQFIVVMVVVLFFQTEEILVSLEPVSSFLFKKFSNLIIQRKYTPKVLK